MTDLKKYCPQSTIGEKRIEVSDDEIINLSLKWKEIDDNFEKERLTKIRSWEKSKFKIVS